MGREMKNKTYILSITVLLLLIPAIPNRAWAADSAQVQASKVKAAFIYNFIKFVDWPQEKAADVNKPLTVGVLGVSPFGNAFDKVKDSQIKGRKVTIKYFEGFGHIKGDQQAKNEEIHKKIKELGQCDVLFLSSSEAESFKLITQTLEPYHILTVSDAKGFLEAGGIINFIMEEKKVRFEINMASAKRSKLEIRSKLLRLAKRVVEKDIHSALIGNDNPIVIAKQ
ncbi:MAG: YfiR family protein [Planctomycetota bacterium]|jgi:hypothetical protein